MIDIDTSTRLFLVIVGLMLFVAFIIPEGHEHPRPGALQPKVAVLPFNNIPGVSGMGRGVAQMVRAALEESLRYRLVEEEKLDRMLRQGRGPTDIVDPVEALRVGRAVKANYVVLGTITKIEVYAGNVRVAADVQAIRTDTGEVVASPYRIGQASKRGFTITGEEFTKTTFYGEGDAAKLIREAAQDLVDQLVAALVKSF